MKVTSGYTAARQRGNYVMIKITVMERLQAKAHGRRSRGGYRGTCPPEFGAGDANANCHPRFCHIGTKMSVLWPSKYAKIRFRPGLCHGPRWGSSRRSPDPLVGWRGDTPPHAPPHSARTYLRRSPCVPPEVQPDLRLCKSIKQKKAKHSITVLTTVH